MPPRGKRGEMGFLPGKAGERGRWAFGLSKLGLNIFLGGLKGMDAWGKLMAQRAKTGPDVPVDTSHLATNIRAGKVTVEGAAKFSVLVGLGKEVPYARAQEMGSGLFAEFGPKKKIEIWAGLLNPGTTKSLDPKMALAFRWEGGPGEGSPGYQTSGPYAGYNVLGRVMHPGVKPTGFLRKAYEASAVEGRMLFLLAIKSELTGKGMARAKAATQGASADWKKLLFPGR